MPTPLRNAEDTQFDAATIDSICDGLSSSVSLNMIQRVKMTTDAVNFVFPSIFGLAPAMSHLIHPGSHKRTHLSRASICEAGKVAWNT
jgi:hypothetical protein